MFWVRILITAEKVRVNIHSTAVSRFKFSTGDTHDNSKSAYWGCVVHMKLLDNY